MSNIPFLIVITLFSTVINIADSLIITPSGRVRGKTVCQNGVPVKVYLGIPYAKPPLGDLRFKKPEPVEPWGATLRANTLPPGCIQYTPVPYPWVDNLPGLSEDCLYLNIWAPRSGNMQQKKSVMIYLHGGGFLSGSGRLDLYNGQVLAAEGDVVVVTINYRLGAEGFFYSGTEDAPGNVGLWDVIEALKWVRNNIEAFGGDKDSITLIGQSAGGIAIGMFCVSPLTRGLFKKAIIESGAVTNLDGEDNSRSFTLSQKLAEIVGCAHNEDDLDQHPQAVVRCMRRKNALKLAKMLSKLPMDNGRLYYPRFDDELLPKNPRESVIDGDFYPPSLLIGTTTGEGGFRIINSMKDVFGSFGEKSPQINLTFGESIIRETFKKYPDPESVVRHYLGGLQEDDFEKIRLKVASSLGDYAITCPSVYLAESFAKKDVAVYYYLLTHKPSNSPWAPWMLTPHMSEAPFVFGNPFRYPQNYSSEEQKFSKQIMQIWSNFAKTGIPLQGIWPEYSKETPVYEVLDVNDNFYIGIGPRRNHCDFFRSHFGF